MLSLSLTCNLSYLFGLSFSLSSLCAVFFFFHWMKLILQCLQILFFKFYSSTVFETPALWLHCFYNSPPPLAVAFPHFPLQAGNTGLLLYETASLLLHSRSVAVVLDSTYSDLPQGLSFSDLLHLEQCPPSPPLLLQMESFIICQWLTSIPVCVCVHKTSSFSNHLFWTLGLLPHTGNYKECCHEHWGACIFLIVFLLSPNVYRSGTAGPSASFFIFWETSKLLFTMLAYMSILINRVQAFSFFPHPRQHLLFVFSLIRHSIVEFHHVVSPLR